MRNVLIAIAATLCLTQAALAEENTGKTGIATDKVTQDSVTKDQPNETAVPKTDVKTDIKSDTKAERKADTLPKYEVKSEPKTDKAPSNYHQASWWGGHGSTWQTGYRSYGFQGYFGGCHYRGTASPHGYHLDKLC